MALTAHEVLKAARQLPPEDQDWVIQELRDPDTDPAEIEGAWARELESRIADINPGKVQMISLEDVLARMNARISAKRTA